MEQAVFADEQVGKNCRHPADDVRTENEQCRVDGLYTSGHLLTAGAGGAAVSGTVVHLAEPQSVHLVSADDREDVHVDYEHQQQRCEEQSREHRAELEMQHEAVNTSRHFFLVNI